MVIRKRLAKLTSDILNPFLVSFVIIILISFESTLSNLDALKWSSIAIALSVLPVFAIVVYLVQNQKLDGIFASPRQQRNKVYMLASAWAIIGCVFLSYQGAPTLLIATFATGLASIVLFMCINLVWKISLHTAFIAASVTILIIVYSSPGAFTAVLLPPVAWARIEMERHSLAQVIFGALLPALITVFVFWLFGLIGAHS
jgi:uncharacterized membrane protein